MAFTDPHADISTIPIKSRGAFNRWKKIKLTPVSERFWKKVNKRGPSECWTFTGPVNAHGYGVFSPWSGHVGRMLAHRYAWEHYNGPIPEGTKICHHCDNPPCVNPHHLFNGTQADNMRDCSIKGRVVSARGEDTWCSVLSELEVSQIRRIYAIGDISYKRLARMFGVHKSTIGAIISRRKWKHVA